jgi:hypothetical protein
MSANANAAKKKRNCRAVSKPRKRGAGFSNRLEQCGQTTSDALAISALGEGTGPNRILRQAETVGAGLMAKPQLGQFNDI